MLCFGPPRGRWGTSVKDEKDTQLIGGVEKREIRIVEYASGWSRMFREHAVIIGGALAGSAERIEHIGSTAVPGLAAKPIIDIIVVVRDSRDEDIYLPQLESAGYSLRVREPGWHEHRMFRSSSLDVHIHVYSRGCPEVERSIRFRDQLRRNANHRQLYEETKRQLALRDWPDMNSYARAKSEVIARILGT